MPLLAIKMNDNQTLLTVRALLQRYPDVVVESHSMTERECALRIKCKRIAMLSRISTWVTATNGTMDFKAPWQRLEYGRRCKTSALEFFITINRSRRKGEPWSGLEILGIYLARDLKAMRRISAKESNRLQRAWHGAIM